MTGPFRSIIVLVVTRSLARVIQLFGIYVVIHGHYSPGGGFQGGALLAAGFILLRLTEGMKASQLEFPTFWGIRVAGVGGLVFLGIGFLALIGGGAFLNYEGIPLGADPVELRHYGILVVEIAIALAVMAALVAIFDDLMGGAPHG